MLSTFTLQRGLVAVLSPKRKEVEETTGGRENLSKTSSIHARIFGYTKCLVEIFQVKRFWLRIDALMLSWESVDSVVLLTTGNKSH